MKRDLEIWRVILLEVEKLPVGKVLASPVNVEGYDQAITAEHVRLLKEAYFIEADIVLGYGFEPGPLQIQEYAMYRLLNDGHDFLANAKNPTIWKKTVDFLAQKGGGGSLAILQGVLTRVASEYFLANS